MILKFWLVVNDCAHLRVVKSNPGLRCNEIAVQMNLELPDTLFTKPEISATIKVAEDQRPKVISPEIVTNIEQAIKQHTGIEVKLKIENPLT